MTIESASESSPQLTRKLGLSGSIILGLGSILGSGVFVSLCLGASIAGYGVFSAILLAGLLAYCNATSSAQLAANYPVSGGTYEYANRLLGSQAGFAAGSLFLLAKSASAAAASIAVAQYLISQLQLPVPPHFLAAAVITVITALAAMGIKQSRAVIAALVTLTLLTLACFIAICLFDGEISRDAVKWNKIKSLSWQNVSTTAHTTALLFVAYTGYGRIATLSEEVTEPKTTIPRAIIATLAVTVILYLSVALAVAKSIDIQRPPAWLSNVEAPLTQVAEKLNQPTLAILVTLGAITALISVLLNLILGLSRVLLAMARRGDAPKIFARLNQSKTSPTFATVAVGLVILAIALTQSFKTSWAFSAFAVLVYYSVTNLSALKLSADQRFYPPMLSWIGLMGCLSLLPWLDPAIIATCLCLTGMLLIARKAFAKSVSETDS